MSENELSITRGTMSKDLDPRERIERTRAIIFDLHHTITKTRESPSELLRNILSEFKIEVADISDNTLQEAFEYMDRWMARYQVEQNVGPHWGGKAEDWIQADRIMLERLGYEFSEQKIMEIEKKWKRETKSADFEWLIEEAIEIMQVLHSRGYTLAIATRRHDDPTGKLKHAEVTDLVSCIEWSGVSGYAKPNPYTLLSVSKQIGVNPRLCAYIGNYVDLDIIAAKRAEMLPVLTTWANPDEEDKAPEDTIVIDSIDELTHLFLGS